MTLKKTEYCVLTSGRVFEVPYGEEKFSLSLSRWLVTEGKKVIIIGSGFVRAKSARLSASKEKIHNKNTVKAKNPPYFIYMLSRFVFSFLCFFKILSVNRKTPLKLIHSQDAGYGSLGAVFAARILHIPIIISSHGIRHKALESVITGKLKKILLKIEFNLEIFIMKRADLIIAINPTIKEYFENLLRNKIEFIPNAVKVIDFQFSKVNRDLIRKELGLSDQTIVIGYIGRLSKEKNIISLLEAFQTASQFNPLVKLVIVGTGSQESELREEVKQRKIADKVIFCGLRKDISRILSALDIFVLPSFIEGISSALLEAMSCERAIIVSNIPGNQQLIKHNENGVLIDPYNPGSLADAIKSFADDSSLRIRLGNSAKIKANQFDETLIFPKILFLYKKIINRHEIQNN